MQARDIGVYALAAAAGLTAPVIYAWLKEQGTRPPKRENVERVASALGKTYEELWAPEALQPEERTRLMQLESGLRRLREVLDELGLPALTARADRDLAALEEVRQGAEHQEEALRPSADYVQRFEAPKKKRRRRPGRGNA